MRNEAEMFEIMIKRKIDKYFIEKLYKLFIYVHNF